MRDTGRAFLHMGVVPSVRLHQFPTGGIVFDVGFKRDLNPAELLLLRSADGIHTVEEIVSSVSKSTHLQHRELEKLLLRLVSERIIQLTSEIQSSYQIPVSGSREYWIPFILYLELTKRCNLKCVRCYADAELEGCDILDGKSWIELGNKLYQAGVRALDLTGGEPLMHSSFLEIVRELSKKFVLSISTNGWLVTPQIVEALVGKVVEMKISLDGATTHTHDFRRGRRGSFDRATKAIQLLSERGIVVVADMVLDQTNIGELDMTCHLAKTLGCRYFRVGIAIPVGRGSEQGWGVELCDIQRVYEAVAALQRWEDDTFAVTKWPEPGKSHSSNCGAGLRSATVSYSGIVKPCPLFDLSLGNLIKEDVRSIFNSDCTAFLAKLKSPVLSNCTNCPELPRCTATDREGCNALPYINLRIQKDLKCAWKDQWHAETWRPPWDLL